MDKVYKSKVGRWYVWICISVAIIFVWSIYMCRQSILVLLIDVVSMGLCLVMMYDILLHTDYTIMGNKLRIRSGVIFRMDLSISKISEITHKSTILSSPALSTKRIGLRYGKSNYVYISPEDQDDFISSLLQINPDIKISQSAD